MKKICISAFAFLLLLSISQKAKAQRSVTNQTKKIMNTTTENPAIEKLLFTYQDALNESDVAKVLTLYTTDGVFMPTNAPTATGQEQLKASYEHVFKTIQLRVKFSISEITVSGDYAYVLTQSKGTTLVHENGQTVPEENRELFVLQRENGDWKISRYMFNKTK
jgi:uncharacterized protein (TIGR02246 family)